MYKENLLILFAFNCISVYKYCSPVFYCFYFNPEIVFKLVFNCWKDEIFIYIMANIFSIIFTTYRCNFHSFFLHLSINFQLIVRRNRPARYIQENRNPNLSLVSRKSIEKLAKNFQIFFSKIYRYFLLPLYNTIYHSPYTIYLYGILFLQIKIEYLIII